MITIEDLHQIQRIIYDPNTPYEARKEVENKLESFQNLEGSWKYHIELISSGVDDHLLFLLCLGLNKILWRVWTKLTASEHEMISSAIIQLIVNRFDNLPQYARSKVEQVVGTICKNNVSYDIGFQLVNACGQSSIIGISTFRTIFEEVLGTDNRLSPDKRSVLTKAAFDIAPQLVSMACNTCVSVIQRLQSSGNGVSSTTTTSPSSSSGAANNEYLLISLNLLKVIIAKIPIGPHVNNDTLNLLFAIAELASTSDAYNVPSLSAVETLSEFMNKRYIPSGGDGSVSGAAAGKEAVATALVDLVSKAVNLIRKYCSIQDADESLIILALLHFISAFAECHLERVLSSCSSPIILSQITLLLRELAVLSCTSGEPQYLLKIAEMWETLLSLDMLKGQLLSAESSTVCAPVLQHMMNSCSIQNNPLLLELLDDLEDDFAIEPFADPHIRELVASGLIDEGIHHSGSGGGGMSGSSSAKLRTSSKERCDKLGGVEEHLCVGTSLRTLTKDCIAEFVGAPDAFAWFSQNLPLLMQQSLQVLGTGADTQRRRKTAAALDICFYVRLLPMCTPSVELLTLLCPLIQQLVESRIYSQGKSFVGVIVTCIQVASQIVQSIGNILNSRSGHGGGNTAAQQAAIETVLSNMTYVLKSVDASCDVAATAPFAIMISTCALLLQSLTALCNRINQSPEIKQNIIDFFNNTLLPRLFNLPIEVHSLLICAADQLLPQISQNMAVELYSLASRICSSQDSIASLADSNHLILLSRYCASLDALARHYSVAAPMERQRFIAAVSSLQECVGPLMKACVGVLSHMSVMVIQSNNTGGIGGSGNGNANPSFAPASTVAKFSSMLGICSLILSLTCGLQQSLGKKSFGQSSLQSFDSCIGFIFSATGGAVMQSAAGLHFIKGSLQLCSTIALASSASDSTVTYQVALTEKLIGFICSYLSDTYICAELLQDTLKTGTIAIGCYWKSDDPKANISSSQPPDSPSKVLHHSLPACLPIALLLNQLFVGSMDASVSPQDAQVAIEGMSQLNEKHNIFSATWFQSGGCWMSVLTGCLRSLLLISHPSLADPLAELLNKLQKSDVSRNGTASPLSQGFWAVLGNETYRIASELGVQETASVYLNELMLRFPQFAHMDMTHYISYVIQPMTADVAKLKST